MTNDGPAQKPPRLGADLSRFPQTFLVRRRALRRAHRIKNDVWFFSNPSPASDPDPRANRFDLDAPEGTCYVADDVETAVREHLRDAVLDRQEISETRAREFRVTEIRTDLSGWFANIAHAGAVRHGVTRELSTMNDDRYAIPRAWARALSQARFGGIRYASRFTTAPSANSWALFGAGGGRRAADPGFERGLQIDGISASRAAGIRVLPIPYSATRLTLLL